MKILEGKVLGVIGGMGPMASNLFYKMVIDNTPAEKDQDHINMIILNHATMPDRTAAIKAGDIEKVKEKLTADAKFLETSGVCSIAAPCNTSHVMLDEIQHQVKVPLLNMIEETVKTIHGQCETGQRIGIMATDGTVEIGLYQKYLKAYGFDPYIPEPEIQKMVMKFIYDNVKKGIPILDEDFAKVQKAFIAAGCSKVILGCTELSVYKEEKNLNEFYLDAMECLAKKAVSMCK
ncbi:MAG: amino acid racemase [Anaerovoracaceae bacterium]